MLIDARSLPDNHLVNADVCVVGSGPAGMAIANEFMGSGYSVCVLESGGLEVDPDTDALSSFQRHDTDGAYPDPRFTHSRAVGGSAHLWSIEAGANPLVRYTMLDPIDFESRSWVAPVGWPIRYESLLPWCDRAHRFSGAGPMDYRPQAWTAPDRQPFAFHGGRIQSKMFTFAERAVFREQMRQRIEADNRVDLYLWANVTELETLENASQVSAVRVACLSGNRLSVQARFIILATGAFDAPRLLLASNRRTPAGLGNDSGHVGRHLMDHQIVDVGTLIPFSKTLFGRAGFYDQRETDHSRVVANLQLSPAMQTEHRLLNSFFGLCARPRLPVSRWVQRPFGRPTSLYSKGIDAFREWRSRDPASPARLDARGVADMLVNADDLVRANLWRFPRLRPEYNIDHGAWFEDPGRDRRFVGFDLYQMCEQAPDPDNRITLGSERDAVGMPVARIRFRWHENNRRSITRTQDLLKVELERGGIGRLHIDRRGLEPALRQMTAHHPAGTTRMSASPADGVVDHRCRVHGIDNLYVTSSSVFPTSGAANPTLTIVALAMRAADDVKAQLAADKAIRAAISAASATSATSATSMGRASSTNSPASGKGDFLSA